ncbi:bacteriocin maturation protein [Metabacillus sp. 84]|uniref:bacteriocin maturation protein n=1 Tax=Metabacillus sp. 84 TaxID=3404705 RepID=UPI003CE7D6B9
MQNLDPSSRLKTNRDTVFVPDPSGSVYFRNNTSSFEMKGKSVAQWIEKLLPLFTGERSLAELTAGLSPEYRDRVFDIVGTLLGNGYVRDVQKELPHQLPEEVLKRFGSQIEFLDELGGSGAARFEKFRQTPVLAAGSGPFFVSLVSAILESGTAKLHLLAAGETDWDRIKELAEGAQLQDPEVRVETAEPDEWEDAIKQFDAVLFVSDHNGEKELEGIIEVCRRGGKLLIPAIFKGEAGAAGSVLQPEQYGEVWQLIRSLPPSRGYVPSRTAYAMLANLIAFEWMKEAAGVQNGEQKCYLLNAETLEGSWETLVPRGQKSIEFKPVDIKMRIGEATERNPQEWFLFFSKLASARTGIFRKWEEGNLSQLPLALCRVQAVHPETGDLLPEIISSGATHEEARKEAGLAGLEAYGAELFQCDEEVHGIGAGETAAEAVCRGIEQALEEELKRQKEEVIPVYPVQLAAEDCRCRYYWQVLNSLNLTPVIGVGREAGGFPVIWAGTRHGWVKSTGLNVTLAARRALQRSLELIQVPQKRKPSAPPVLLEHSFRLMIPEYDVSWTALYRYAATILEREEIVLDVDELTGVPFLKEGAAEIFRVTLRKGEVQ